MAFWGVNFSVYSSLVVFFFAIMFGYKIVVCIFAAVGAVGAQISATLTSLSGD